MIKSIIRLIGILTGIGCFANLHQAYGQPFEFSTGGKSFWVGFPHNGFGCTPISLDEIKLMIYIKTSAKNARATVSLPGSTSNWRRTLNLSPDTMAVVQVPTELAMQRNGANPGTAVHIQTTDTAFVYALTTAKATTDASVIFPEHALQDNYRIITYRDAVSPAATYVQIIAVDDSTECNIFRPNGSPLLTRPIKLNRGQSYLYTHSGDLTGFFVRSTGENCRALAVFTGSPCTIVTIGPLGTNKSTADILYEQLPPLTSWSKEFVVINFSGVPQDRLRIVADQPDTKVTIYWSTGPEEITLNAGGVKDTVFNEVLYIKSDKPIAIAQLSISLIQGNGNPPIRLPVADPSMVIIGGLDLAITKESFVLVFPDTTLLTRNFKNYINLITRTQDVGALTINGKPVGPFLPVPGNPEYSYLETGEAILNNLLIQDSTYRIKSPKGFSAIVYGFADADSYSFLAGIGFKTPPIMKAKLDSVKHASCFGSRDGSAAVSAEFGVPPYRYVWSFKDSISITESASQTGRILPAGRYYCDVFDTRGCRQRLWFTITQPARVIAGISPSPNAVLKDTLKYLSICKNEVGRRLVANIEGGVWSGKGITPDGIILPNIIGIDTIRVEYKAPNGCVDSVSVGVVVPPQAIYMTSPPITDTLATPDRDTMRFYNRSFGKHVVVKGQWDFDGLAPDTVLSSKGVQRRFNTQTERYKRYAIKLTVTDTNACKDDTIQYLTVFRRQDVSVPNFFTPNGDGINDNFEVDATNLDNVSLKIYDRWGKQLYSSDKLRWNGTINGNGDAVPAGIYFYVLEYNIKVSDTDKVGLDIVRQGSITLIR